MTQDCARNNGNGGIAAGILRHLLSNSVALLLIAVTCLVPITFSPNLRVVINPNDVLRPSIRCSLEQTWGSKKIDEGMLD